MLFDSPQYWFAVEYPGTIRVELHFDDSKFFAFETSSFFVGFISDEPFNRIVMRDPSDGVVAIDDIYFGPPVVPAPGALVVLVGTLTIGSRRRR